MNTIRTKKTVHNASMLMVMVAILVGLISATALGADHPHDRTHEVVFKKGKVYEIAFASIKEGKEQQLHAEYFPQIGPLVAEYGAAALGMFKVTRIIEGELEPQIIGIFEWPSLEAKNKFDKDPRFLAISPLRDDALSFFETSFYEVDEDVTVAFHENKTYEFFGAWLTPNAAELLGQYFAASEPIKRSYGRPYPEFKVNFKPAAGLSPDHVYAPHMAGIVEWDQAQDFFVLMANEKFKAEAAPLLNQAVARIDMLQATVTF